MKKITLTLFLLLALIKMYGQTNISGGIYTDTTWTKLSSPIIVTGDVVFQAGVCLTIEAGVTVKFANNTYIYLGQHNARIVAIGNKNDSITFTSNSTSPYPGIYRGVDIGGSYDSSFFNYCNFKYAYFGLKDGNQYDQLQLKNSLFSNNIHGLYAGSCSGITGLGPVDSCIFRNNIYGLSNLAGSEYTNCIIDSNQIGINLGISIVTKNCLINANQIGVNGYSSWFFYCRFKNNQCALFNSGPNNIKYSYIENNQYGIIDSSGGATTMQHVYIRHNTFGLVLKHGGAYDSYLDSCYISNNDYGLVGESYNVQIKNSYIDSNTFVGIKLDSNAKNNSIISCIIRKNGIGIMDYGGALPHNTIKGNIIENNDVGIKLGNSTDTVFCNRICNNTSFALKYFASVSRNLSNNYWCTIDSSSTAPLIQDGNDTSGVGIIYFTPLDTAMCYLTASINSINNRMHFSIYPNPNNGAFTVETNNATKQTIQIFDVNGNLVLSQTINGKTNIDANNLSEGIYNISISNNEGVTNKRLVIVK